MAAFFLSYIMTGAKIIYQGGKVSDIDCDKISFIIQECGGAEKPPHQELVLAFNKIRSAVKVYEVSKLLNKNNNYNYYLDLIRDFEISVNSISNKISDIKKIFDKFNGYKNECNKAELMIDYSSVSLSMKAIAAQSRIATKNIKFLQKFTTEDDPRTRLICQDLPLIFIELIKRKPTFSISPTTNRHGPYVRFIIEIFDYFNIDQIPPSTIKTILRRSDRFAEIQISFRR